MKVKLLLISTLMLLLLNTSSASLPQQSNAPTLVIRDSLLVSDGLAYRGFENDSRSPDFYYSTITNGRITTRLFGEPTISKNNLNVTVSGDVNKTTRFDKGYSISTYQSEEYISGIPVDERFHNNSRITDSNSEIISVDRTIRTPFTFNILDNLPNIIRRDLEQGITVFIQRDGNARHTYVNNTRAGVDGQIFYFDLSTTFIFFETGTKEFLAQHTVMEKGYGNMLPNFLVDYLNNKTLSRQGNAAPERINQMRWLDIGYNSTYGLNLFMGIYHFERSAFTMILSNEPDSELSPNILSADMESIVDNFVADELVDGFEIDDVQTVNEDIFDNVFSDEIIQISDDTDSIFSLDTLTQFRGQIVALLVITITFAVYLKRRR